MFGKRMIARFMTKKLKMPASSNSCPCQHQTFVMQFTNALIPVTAMEMFKTALKRFVDVMIEGEYKAFGQVLLT
jgi:hypothetical protein